MFVENHTALCKDAKHKSRSANNLLFFSMFGISSVLFTNKVHTGISIAGRNKQPNRIGRTEPDRLILGPAGTGRGNEPYRTGTSHYAC